MAVGATLIFATPRHSSVPAAPVASVSSPSAESSPSRSIAAPLESIRAMESGLGDTSQLVRGPHDGFEELGARFAAAEANSGDCKDCRQAINDSGKTAVPDLGAGGAARGDPGGSTAYIGPCQGGFVYRVTNFRSVDLPPFLIGDNGEVWKVPGRIQRGQWVDIRSKTRIAATLSAYKP
jgi:hypothetical protein